MKKMTYIVMALALVLGLAQCKKEQIPTNNPTGGFSITLEVNGGDNGNSKVVVDPTGHTNPDYATVTFENGDIIYVGNNGQYCGTLTYNGNKFEGTISGTDFNDEDYLHFYFLGGEGFNPTIDEPNNTATVNIADQSSKYPVISYAHSEDYFSEDVHSYKAKLQNKVSIIKFNVTTPSTAAICITGMKNTVSVNFETPNGTDNGFSYSQTDGGLIKMHGKDAEGVTWAIVLPQEEVPAGTAGTAYTADGFYTGTRPAIARIGSNQYLSDGVTVKVDETTPIATPLTLEALTDGTIEVQDPQSGMKYSLNGVVQEGEPTSITVSAGDKVQFYGNGTSITCYDGTTIAGGDASVKAYGNIMSLIDETGYATLTTLPNQDYVFMGLFYGNTNLTDASGLLLPATTMANNCYDHMFYDCGSLTAAPALPATTLAGGCYLSMFDGCSSLTAAPALPATTLAEYCYTNMFYGCSSLTAAPALPATTLASKCYSDMFAGCTSLTTAPALPATTLADFCYSYMFKGCYSLTSAPALPATTLVEGCYRQMFQNCTSLTTAPALPATTLVSLCYYEMFKGCTSLSSITCLATSGINQSSSTQNWVNGVPSSGTFTKASGVTSWPTGNNGIPTNWTVISQ